MYGKMDGWIDVAINTRSAAACLRKDNDGAKPVNNKQKAGAKGNII